MYHKPSFIYKTKCKSLYLVFWTLGWDKHPHFVSEKIKITTDQTFDAVWKTEPSTNFKAAGQFIKTIFEVVIMMLLSRIKRVDEKECKTYLIRQQKGERAKCCQLVSNERKSL